MADKDFDHQPVSNTDHDIIQTTDDGAGQLGGEMKKSVEGLNVSPSPSARKTGDSEDGPND